MGSHETESKGRSVRESDRESESDWVRFRPLLRVAEGFLDFELSAAAFPPPLAFLPEPLVRGPGSAEADWCESTFCFPEFFVGPSWFPS